jgi:ssDNA-binding Zn-finger/Zn-ribbon topoisomerase 1
VTAATYDCPSCGSPLELRGNQWGEQFYGCTRYPMCRGSRDAYGAFYLLQASSPLLVLERVNMYGEREQLRAPNSNTGSWYTLPGTGGTRYLDSATSAALDALVPSLATTPQRTMMKMFAVAFQRGAPPRIEPRDRPRGRLEHALGAAEAAPAVVPNVPAPPQEKTMTLKEKLVDQGKGIGEAIMDGLAEATVEEAGDVLLDIAKDFFEDEALFAVLVASPDGRELLKSVAAFIVDSLAVHTSIPKGPALRTLARYQYRSSARRVGGPRIGKVMRKIAKLVELGERLPALEGGEANVVDFAAAVSEAKTAAR